VDNILTMQNSLTFYINK